MPVFPLHPGQYSFPDPELAEDGLLAVGGDLHPDRLLAAYRQGIFPWYNQQEPILWWSPDPRFVLYPGDLKVSASMQQLFRKNAFEVTCNKAFTQVIRACAQVPRFGQDGTWLHEEMIAAYEELHRRGHVHSVEVWQGGELVGGLYGVKIGRVFCGESMFHRVSNASKYGFIYYAGLLAEEGCELIDCQVHTSHLESLGARFISRKEYLSILRRQEGI